MRQIPSTDRLLGKTSGMTIDHCVLRERGPVKSNYVTPRICFGLKNLFKSWPQTHYPKLDVSCFSSVSPKEYRHIVRTTSPFTAQSPFTSCHFSLHKHRKFLSNLPSGSELQAPGMSLCTPVFCHARKPRYGKASCCNANRAR